MLAGEWFISRCGLDVRDLGRAVGPRKSHVFLAVVCGVQNEVVTCKETKLFPLVKWLNFVQLPPVIRRQEMVVVPG
jgi:hypothetical protein